jgi:hypothetical protein
VKSFYYRAFDEAGGKKTGTIQASDQRAADAELRRGGLRPYFLNDVESVKKALRARRRRRRIIAISGGAAVALAFFLGGAMVRYAGRERPPDVQQYRQAGLIREGPNIIVADTKEEREFAQEMHDTWEGFYPGIVTGLDVKKLLMTVYVTNKVYDLAGSEVELLASNTARALQRRFNTNGCTLLVVEGETTILEVAYTALTKSTRVKSYR